MKSAGPGRMWGLVVFAAAFVAWPVGAQQIHRNPFERETGWVRSGTNAVYEEGLHNIGDEAHDGLRSEHLQFVVTSPARPGSYIHYQYNLGHADVSDEFSARVWIKANRPGIRLSARLILPHESEKTFIENRLSTLLPGDEYKTVGHWQKLTIPRVQKLVREARQALQSKEQLGRSVEFKDAYIDALVLNVYGGPGNTEVWIDELEVGPLAGAVPRPSAAVAASRPAASPPAVGQPPISPLPAVNRSVRNPFIKFNGTQLFVGDRKFLMRGIRQTDTPLRVLHDAGFNTVFFDAPHPTLVREATDLNLWLVPQLHVLGTDPRFVSADNVSQEVARFADNDSVIMFDVGNKLNRLQADNIARGMQAIQNTDAGRYFGGDVSDGLQHYRHMNFLVGASRWPLGSSLEMLGYRDWLEQRRKLAHPGAYLWTWIQTHLPDEYTLALYDRTGHDAFSEAVGPLPEQIRLMAYTALGSGCKGLGFWSDRWLADSHHGRDRLLCCAMLNQELDMLEPILTQQDEPPLWIDTSVPDVKAAILRTAKGALVLPVWLGKGSQFVPGQAAVGKLTMVVPHIPQTMQAWDVHPADVHSLKCERVVGGTRVTVNEFGMTAAILFSADLKLVHRLQEQCQTRRQLAAQWSYDLALYELIKVRRVHDQLAVLGQAPVQANHLLAEAEKRLRSAQELWENHNFSESYHESQRALRPVRILMRQHWDRAVKKLDVPVGSAYAVSFFTLPRFWQFMDFKDQLVATANALPGGDFETLQQRPQETWHSEETINDDVEVSATRVADVIKTDKKGVKSTEAPHGGRQCAMLQIKASAKRPAPTVLENTRIAIVSPTVKLPPGTWVQVTAWMYLTEGITASAEGAMFYDSVGGEALAVRITEPMKKWKKFTLYRRVPPSGTIYATVALTGLGNAYFDDVTIEPLVAASGAGGGSPVLVRYGGGPIP